MSRDVAVAAGRGFLVILASKIYFILTSAVLGLGLPRLFGDPAAFGRYRTVNGFATLANMVLITAAIQTAARVVADPAAARGGLRAVTLLAGGLGVVWATAVSLWAEPLAGLLFADPSFAPWLRLAALIALGYSFYGVLVGRLNGARRFVEQAGLDIVFSTAKVALVLGAVALGYGVSGGLTGFLAATLLAIGVAAIFVSRGREAAPDEAARPRDTAPSVAGLFLPLLGTQLLLNLLLQLDGIAVKGLLTSPLEAMPAAARAELGAALGALEGEALAGAALADRLAGLYGAARNVGLLPYQATFALTLVVFPILSDPRLRAAGGDAATAIRGALRFTALAGGAFVATLSGAAPALTRALFGDAYAASSTALAVLVIGGALLSVFVLLTTILSATGNEGRGLLTMALSSATAAVALALALRSPEPQALVALGPEALLLRAALVTTGAAALGCVAAGFALSRAVPGCLPLANGLRLVVAAGAGAAAAVLVPAGTTGFGPLVIRAAVGGLAYGATLLVTRELGRDDLELLKRLLRRQRREST